MKKYALFSVIFFLFSQLCTGQTVFGYWYGFANVKTTGSANNYLVEMILQPENNSVKGILNYYFKSSYRSLQVKGKYNPATRKLVLEDIPVVYHGSGSDLEVDCKMDLVATLRVSQVNSVLAGQFIAKPDYKYTCPPLNFSFTLNGDISKKDSVMQALADFKETYQVWKPADADTVITAKVIPRKVINYVIEKEFKERETEISNEVEVESDSLRLDIFDNGEIDGDIISLFYNKELIVFNQKLTHKAIHLDIVIDPNREGGNEITLFAENLGLIPPNTALVRIRDGKKVYDLRVTSSLEKNATIRIKRKID